jgi:group II intron reverse transcriptase/maturase
MEQKLDYRPSTESQLKCILDDMFLKSKQAFEKGEVARFKGLMEIISSEVTIVSAIHKIKANKGSMTVGCDGQDMQHDILENDYQKIVTRIQEAFKDYKALPVRRVYIPKQGKSEKRPLGIPAIIDRIIQECVRMVLDPILEAQFFVHSYGFRPMRSADMALERITSIVHKTGYRWIIEGDISKYFDTINHPILLKKLWSMGIRDRRILMVIKQMLKAGIMGELVVNPQGTPQGGIVSPLLANVYLNSFDWFVTKQWQFKKTRSHFKENYGRLRMLRLRSNLKPAYLIRYADDWVLVTNSRRNAEKWKCKIEKFLRERLKITLSQEKTVITDITKKAIHFLGFEYKLKSGKSRTGYIPSTRPDRGRLKLKIKEIHNDIKKLRRLPNREVLVSKMNVVNSKIRSLIFYYQGTTAVNMELTKYAKVLSYAAYKSLIGYGGTWTPANQTNNLISVHEHYTTQIPAIEYRGYKIGITAIHFVKFQKIGKKVQRETPYTVEGRELYIKRTNKVPLRYRPEVLLSDSLARKIASGLTPAMYNFEYFLNRAYTFNRHRGKCRVCGLNVSATSVDIHHINPLLPMESVNKVSNLATLHENCHQLIHSKDNLDGLSRKEAKKVQGFREKLGSVLVLS